MPCFRGHDKGFGHLHHYVTEGFLAQDLPFDYTLRVLPTLSPGLRTVQQRNATFDYLDMSKKGPNGSHCRILHTSGWTIPDLNKAYRELCVETDFMPDGCGSYYHLYLDWYEIVNALGSIAIRNRQNDTVQYRGNTYTLSVFQSFLYASYANYIAEYADYYMRLLDSIPDDLPSFGRYPGLRDNWKKKVRDYPLQPHGGYKLYSPADLDRIVRTGCESFVNQHPEIIGCLRLLT